MAAVMSVVLWALAGLNGWFLLSGHGGPLNAIALATCVGSAIFVLDDVLVKISPNLRARIRAHSCFWQSLPEVVVESAAVDDEQTEAWSKAMYDKDLANERKPRTGETPEPTVQPIVVGMRPRVLRRNLGLAFLGAVLAGAVLGTGIARAEPIDDYVATDGPVVCSLLDSDPTVAGVEHVGMALYGKGLTAQQAGEVLVRSVIGLCPRHTPELNAFIVKWQPASRVMA